MERYPTSIESRASERGAQTLVHGDAHFWNFLLPKRESEPAVLIDWQLWGVGFGASDLAYMIALHWFPERRSRYEERLLAAYLEELNEHGVEYGQDDLWHDYRLAVAGLPLQLMGHAYAHIPANIWWPHLDRAFSALSDLDCGVVLSS